MTERGFSLPNSRWPNADRDCWVQACVPARRLRPGGAATGMKSVTQKSYARAYGYLLEFCDRTGILDIAADTGAHVTPDIVGAFLSELGTRVGSVTRHVYICRIRRVGEMLVPGRTFMWLREMESELRNAARPRPKYHRITDSNRLLKIGLDLIGEGEAAAEKTALQRARLVRDGLMIALLALCPIRLKNLASLRLGQQIRNINGGWWITLAGNETKTGRPDERPLPDILNLHIDGWLSRWRPHFLAPADAFWASTKGGALAYTYVGTIITEVTRRKLGVPVNPHLFRDCAVHTVAFTAGHEMGIASALLQHTDQRVTEKHYNKGASVSAARKYQDMIRNLAAV